MEKPSVGLNVLDDALGEISAASEAARLQLHLLSLEARQRGGALGASIEALEHRLDRSLHHALATGAEKARLGALSKRRSPAAKAESHAAE